MKGKQQRRQLYADIDLKRTQRFGTLCSAFQALQMPVSSNISVTIVTTNVTIVEFLSVYM